MKSHLVWLRHDLRITDNRALHAACLDDTARVIVLFIATPQQWQGHDMAPRQADFLRRHLMELQAALAALGIALRYHQVARFADIPALLAHICVTEQVTDLFLNRQYELNEQRRDAAVQRQLAPTVTCHLFDDSVLLAPGQVVSQQGSMLRVFTPFRRAWLQCLSSTDYRSLPAPKARAQVLPINHAALTPFDYPTQASDHFPAGENAALARLDYFCCHAVAHYHQQRDFPALQGTSQLSPYLTLGIVSPRQCLNALQNSYPEVLHQHPKGPFSWLNELIWREFYRHLLVAFPSLCQHRPFIAWTEHVVWQHNQTWLEAWQQGQTGYPLVDAAMRQLNTIGWMHNRLRMVTASFLIKHLQLDWRLGERYFMQQLIDGDLAANNGGWQWCASTGCDAAPYFRIFNPTLQSQRFDPDGAFIRTWVPELKHLSKAPIHQPYHKKAAPEGPLAYPRPMVEHREARQHTLAAFSAAKARFKT